MRPSAFPQAVVRRLAHDVLHIGSGRIRTCGVLLSDGPAPP